MRKVYTVLLYLCAPLLLLYLLWRTRKTHDYRHRWRELFGIFPKLEKTGGIWLHAVSLGEVMAAMPLIKAILKHYPEQPLTVTTMTLTGSTRLRQTFGDDVFHVYVPLDFPGAVKRFLTRIQPRLAIFMETELWPNKIFACSKANIPTLIANACVSAESVQGYRRFRSFIASVISSIDWLLVQTEVDAMRYQELGMPASRISVAGNIKFELDVSPQILEQAQVLRRQLLGRPVWIAASTHEGEEVLVLQAFAKIRQQIPQALLLLVPRHPTRFNEVKQICSGQGYEVALRTVGETNYATTDVFLGNTTGELMLFYAVSDVAFVGGSLVPIGGHNILEPARLGLPVLIGPKSENIQEVYELLHQAQASIMVDDVDQLALEVTSLLADPERAQRMGKRGKEVVEQNRGALDKHMETIARLLDS